MAREMPLDSSGTDMEKRNNALHDALEDLSKELAFSYNYTNKAVDQWRVAALVPKCHTHKVISEFAKNGLHLVGDLAPAGDCVACLFQTAHWRD